MNYLWSKEADAKKVFDRYMYLKKIMVFYRFDCNEECKAMINKWGDQRMEWRKYFRDWQDKLKKANEWREEQKKKAEAEAAEAPKEGEEAATEEKPAEDAEKPAEEGEKKEEAATEEKKDGEIDYSKILDLDNADFAAKFDAFNGEDICNMDGNGMPLFAKFQQEDWTLAGLRYEIHCLLQVFKKMVPTEIRPGIHKNLFCDYFNMVYRREFVPSHYGSENMESFFKMMEDTMTTDEDGLLIDENGGEEVAMTVFIRLTEMARRIRIAAIEGGDESAKLVFKMSQARPDRSKGKGKGKGKGRDSGGRRDERRGDNRRESYKGSGRDAARSGGYGGKGSSRAAPTSVYAATSYGASSYGASSRGGGNSYGSYPMSGDKRGGNCQDDSANKRRNYGSSGYGARR